MVLGFQVSQPDVKKNNKYTILQVVFCYKGIGCKAVHGNKYTVELERGWGEEWRLHKLCLGADVVLPLWRRSYNLLNGQRRKVDISSNLQRTNFLYQLCQPVCCSAWFQTGSSKRPFLTLLYHSFQSVGQLNRSTFSFRNARGLNPRPK